MKPILFIFLFVFTVSSYAQYQQRSTLGMSGSTSIVTVGEANYYISASVGQQSVIGTISNEEYTIRQGFQQPPIRVMALPENGNALEATVYPNPVGSFVTVSFGMLITSDILTSLYDIQGRDITTTNIGPTQSFQLDMSQLASGTYVLKVLVGTDSFITRLIKN